MRKFTAKELRKFLAAVDEHLTSDEEIVVLGGGALALAYNDHFRTNDIDLYRSPSRAVVRACKLAREATGLAVPLGPAGVSDAPYEAETRLVDVLKFKHLRVRVLDVYDLALSKAVRGESKDWDAIRGLHERRPLDENTLVDRYLHEMDHAIGDPRARDLNFLNLIEHLYGLVEAERVQELLASRGPPLPKRRRSQHKREQ